MESSMGWGDRNRWQHGIYFFPAVVKKLLCYLIFFLLETLIILGSIVVVVCFYLPFVVLKGVVMTVTGKATPKIQDRTTIANPNAHG